MPKKIYEKKSKNTAKDQNSIHYIPQPENTQKWLKNTTQSTIQNENMLKVKTI
jgi:hypothetical protein